MPPFNEPLFFFGCAAALIPDVLRIVKTRHNPHLPAYMKSFNFWLGLILLVALGGLAAWLAGAKDIKEALAYGYAAPEFISRLLSEPTTGAMGVKAKRGAPGLGVRLWWAN